MLYCVSHLTGLMGGSADSMTQHLSSEIVCCEEGFTYSRSSQLPALSGFEVKLPLKIAFTSDNLALNANIPMKPRGGGSSPINVC